MSAFRDACIALRDILQVRSFQSLESLELTHLYQVEDNACRLVDNRGSVLRIAPEGYAKARRNVAHAVRII